MTEIAILALVGITAFILALLVAVPVLYCLDLRRFRRSDASKRAP